MDQKRLTSWKFSDAYWLSWTFELFLRNCFQLIHTKISMYYGIHNKNYQKKHLISVFLHTGCDAIVDDFYYHRADAVAINSSNSSISKQTFDNRWINDIAYTSAACYSYKACYWVPNFTFPCFKLLLSIRINCFWFLIFLSSNMIYPQNTECIKNVAYYFC